MKIPFVRKLLSRRRLLAVLGIAALLVGLAMLHPYPRQSLFGPTIRGKPWCVWETKIRRLQHRRPSWTNEIRDWLHGCPDADEINHPEMVPVVAALLDDPNPNVRAACRRLIADFPSLRHRSHLPALRKWYVEDEIHGRMNAGCAIIRIEKDAEVLRWLVTLLDHPDPQVPVSAVHALSGLADVAPEVYPHIVSFAKDTDLTMRTTVMVAMLQFGKKGLPVLIDGLNDTDLTVRYNAIVTAGQLGADAKEALPALEAHLRDPNPVVRDAVVDALIAIDPQRFQHLKANEK